MALVLAYRNSFVVLFTGDRNMQAAVGKVAHLLATTMVLNSVQPVMERSAARDGARRAARRSGHRGDGAQRGAGWGSHAARDRACVRDGDSSEVEWGRRRPNG